MQTLNIEICKTRHGDHTNGMCGSPNNCRFSGSGTVWTIDVNGFKEGLAVKRKKDAICIMNTLVEALKFDPDFTVEKLNQFGAITAFEGLARRVICSKTNGRGFTVKEFSEEEAKIRDTFHDMKVI